MTSRPVGSQTQVETENTLYLTLHMPRLAPPPPARRGYQLGVRQAPVRPPRPVSSARSAVIANNLAQRRLAGKEGRMKSFLAQVAAMSGVDELKRADEANAQDPIARADALTTFVIERLDPTQHLLLISNARALVQMLVPAVRLDAFFLQCRIRLMEIELDVADRHRRNLVAQAYMASLETVSAEVNAHLDARYASIQERVRAWGREQRQLTDATRLTLQILEQKIGDVQSRFLAQVDEMKRAQEDQRSIEQLIGECEILLGGLG